MYLFDPSRIGGVESGEWGAKSGEWRAGSGERRVENGGGKRTKKKRSPKGLRFVVGVGGGVRTHDLQIHNLAL